MDLHRRQMRSPAHALGNGSRQIRHFLVFGFSPGTGSKSRHSFAPVLRSSEMPWRSGTEVSHSLKLLTLHHSPTGVRARQPTKKTARRPSFGALAATTLQSLDGAAANTHDLSARADPSLYVIDASNFKDLHAIGVFTPHKRNNSRSAIYKSSPGHSRVRTQSGAISRRHAPFLLTRSNLAFSRPDLAATFPRHAAVSA